MLEVGEIWANSSGKKGPDHKRHWCKRDGMLSHPAAGLVVVEVHQLAGAVQSPGNFIGFSLADVDKVLSKSEQGEVSSSQQVISVFRFRRLPLTCIRTRCCPRTRPRSTRT